MVGYKLNLLRKMLTKKYLIILLLFFSLASWAQPRSFSRNPSVFIKEYSKFLSSQADKQEQVLLENFTTKWDSWTNSSKNVCNDWALTILFSFLGESMYSVNDMVKNNIDKK